MPETVPTCAICLQPLAGMVSCALVGTEVVHKACARSGGVTELWRTRRALADAQEERQRASNDARAELETAKRAMRAAMAQRNQAELAVLAEITARRRAQDECDAMIRERDAARAEMATLRAQNAAAPRVVTPDSEPTVDATSLRFSLLDLD